MLVEIRDRPSDHEPVRMPAWQRQYRRHHANGSKKSERFAALVNQTAVELETLTKLATGGAQRRVCDQQSELIDRLLARIERDVADEDSGLQVDNNLIVAAALQKRADRRKHAAVQAEQDASRNARQLRWNALCERALSDCDLVKDLATRERGIDAAWSRQLGQRLRATAVALLELIADPQGVDVTVPEALHGWLERTQILIEKEKELTQ